MQGDLFDKAAFLLKNLIQQHPFASGNRRTALIATEMFLVGNGIELSISKEDASFLKKIRQCDLDDNKIKSWAIGKSNKSKFRKIEINKCIEERKEILDAIGRF